MVTVNLLVVYRPVARSENPGGHVVLGGDNVPPLVEIGLTGLPKTYLSPGNLGNYFLFHTKS